MQLILYGTAADQDALLRSLAALPDWCYREMTVTACPDYDRFIASLGESPPDCIVIAMDGAAGMEGVIAAKSVCETVPVLWFSDDNGFGVQSYRLGCTYFHQKPVSPQILSAAIAKCV